MGLIRRQPAQVAPRRNGSEPIVADVHPDFGLYIGPKSGIGYGSKGPGLSFKMGKWGHLFTTDPEGVTNLMNILTYLWEEGHPNVSEMMNTVEKFIKEYKEWKKDTLAG